MAGKMIELTAADGHTFAAYRCEPQVVDGEKPKGGLVVIQEIFGLTGQMKRCADRYAEAGFHVVMPALFDRAERDAVFAYTDFQGGGGMAMSLDEADLMADVEAARQSVAGERASAIVGFCWGGSVAYQAACQLNFACAASYYGGGIGQLVDRMQPKAAVIYHFGADDAFIPEQTIDRIREADPAGEFHVYEPAGHGFSCDDREGYNAEASALAEQRTLAFFDAHL